MLAVDLRSRRGMAGPLGFLVSLPAWLAMVSLALVIGLWFWASAISIGAMSSATAAYGVGRNGRAVQEDFLRAGLMGLARPYRDAASFTLSNGAVIGRLAHTEQVRITNPGIPPAFTVKVTTLARAEYFRPRPPSGGWE